MTVTDFVLIGLLVYFVWNGFRTGFVMQVVGFVGVFVAYWAAKVYSPTITPWLERVLGKSGTIPTEQFGTGIANSLTNGVIHNGYGVAAYAIVFAVVLFATRLAGHFLNLIVSLPGLSLINRAAGLIVGAVIGVLILLIAVNLSVYLPIEALQHALQGSQVASVLLHADVSKLLFAW